MQMRAGSIPERKCGWSDDAATGTLVRVTGLT